MYSFPPKVWFWGVQGVQVAKSPGFSRVCCGHPPMARRLSGCPAEASQGADANAQCWCRIAVYLMYRTASVIADRPGSAGMRHASRRALSRQSPVLFLQVTQNLADRRSGPVAEVVGWIAWLMSVRSCPTPLPRLWPPGAALGAVSRGRSALAPSIPLF